MINSRRPPLGYTLVILLASAFFLYFLMYWISNDFPRYLEYVVRSNGLDFFSYYEGGIIEIGSGFLLWLSGQYFSPYHSVFLIGFGALCIKQYIFVRYLHYASLGFVSYVLVFAKVLDANQIREAIAVCFVFLALFIEPKRKYTYLLITAIGLVFHFSAILILSLYFARQFTILLVLLLLTFLYFTDVVTYYPQLSFANVWITKSPGHVSFTNPFFLVQTSISISAILIWKNLSSIQKKAVYFNTVGVVVYLLFYEYPDIAHRVREITVIAIIPLLFFDRFKVTYPSLVWSAGLLFYVLLSAYMVITEFGIKYVISDITFGDMMQCINRKPIYCNYMKSVY